jgi:anti-sigma B factor antagonist
MTAHLVHPAPASFAAETALSAGGRLVTVRGDVDATTAPGLRACLLAALEGPGAADVEVDLTGVTFLDSAGLTVLVVAHQAAERAGCAVRLRCGGTRAVTRPLELTGLSTVLAVVDA